MSSSHNRLYNQRKSRRPKLISSHPTDSKERMNPQQIRERERNQTAFLINYPTKEKRDEDYKLPTLYLHPRIHNQCPSPIGLSWGCWLWQNRDDYFFLTAPRTVMQKLTLVIIQLSIQRHPYQGILITFGPIRKQQMSAKSWIIIKKLPGRITVICHHTYIRLRNVTAA